MANHHPTLEDLQEGRVTAEEFLASRNGYRMAPRKVVVWTIKPDRSISSERIDP